MENILLVILIMPVFGLLVFGVIFVLPPVKHTNKELDNIIEASNNLVMENRKKDVEAIKRICKNDSKETLQN